METYIRSGNYAAKPSLPYTPGSDGAGVIEHSSGGFSKGERVFLAGSITGTYAKLALCTPEQVFRLPEDISFEQGAALGVPYGTAHRALFERGQGRAGETVLVHDASGGVGTAAVQLAHAAGLRVFGTASTEEGRKLVRESGADEVFDHRAPGYLEEILAATGGQGVNLILEMLANVNLGKDLALLGKGGRVVVIGSRGPVEINPRDLMARDADIRGMMLGHAPEAERAHIYTDIAAGLAAGTLQPAIGRIFPLAQAAEAHQTIMESSAAGKIVLKI